MAKQQKLSREEKEAAKYEKLKNELRRNSDIAARSENIKEYKKNLNSKKWEEFWQSLKAKSPFNSFKNKVKTPGAVDPQQAREVNALLQSLLPGVLAMSPEQRQEFFDNLKNGVVSFSLDDAAKKPLMIEKQRQVEDTLRKILEAKTAEERADLMDTLLSGKTTAPETTNPVIPVVAGVAAGAVAGATVATVVNDGMDAPDAGFAAPSDIDANQLAQAMADSDIDPETGTVAETSAEKPVAEAQPAGFEPGEASREAVTAMRTIKGHTVFDSSVAKADDKGTAVYLYQEDGSALIATLPPSRAQTKTSARGTYTSYSLPNMDKYARVPVVGYNGNGEIVYGSLSITDVNKILSMDKEQAKAAKAAANGNPAFEGASPKATLDAICNSTYVSMINARNSFDKCLTAISEADRVGAYQDAMSFLQTSGRAVEYLETQANANPFGEFGEKTDKGNIVNLMEYMRDANRQGAMGVSPEVASAYAKPQVQNEGTMDTPKAPEDENQKAQESMVSGMVSGEEPEDAFGVDGAIFDESVNM